MREAEEIAERADKLDRSVTRFTAKWSTPLLRWALGITYLWFGALKIFGASPVSELVEKGSSSSRTWCCLPPASSPPPPFALGTRSSDPSWRWRHSGEKRRKSEPARRSTIPHRDLPLLGIWHSLGPVRQSA